MEGLVHFILRFQSVESGNQDRTIRSISKIRSHINNFLSTFIRDDACVLVVSLPDVQMPGFALRDLVEDWIAFERLASASEARVVINPPDLEGLAATGGAIELDLETVLPGDLLFRLFQERSGGGGRAYEVDATTNLYDPDFINLYRACGKPGRGSTKALHFAEPLGLLLDDGAGVGSILDVGCGAGFFYDLIRKACVSAPRPMPFYVGIDASRSQIARAKERFPQALFRRGDAASLDFPDRLFDLAVSYSVLRFLPADHILAGVSELLRVSRKGAFFSLLCTADHLLFPGDPARSSKLFGLSFVTTEHHPSLEGLLHLLHRYPEVAWKTTNVFVFERRGTGGSQVIDEGTAEYTGLLAECQRLIEAAGGTPGNPTDPAWRERIEAEMGALTRIGGVPIPPGSRWAQYTRVEVFPRVFAKPLPAAECERLQDAFFFKSH